MLVALAGALTACRRLARDAKRTGALADQRRRYDDLADGVDPFAARRGSTGARDAVDRAMDHAGHAGAGIDRRSDRGQRISTRSPTGAGSFPPLAKRVRADRQEALARAIERTGRLGRDAFDGYKDWPRRSSVDAGTERGDALNPRASAKNGIDAQLWKRSRRVKPERVALEQPGSTRPGARYPAAAGCRRVMLERNARQCGGWIGRLRH